MVRSGRQKLADHAGVSVRTVDNFYADPTVVREQTTEQIMRSLAATGYVNTGPLRQGGDPLAGKTILYELPRAWSSSDVNPVFAATMAELATESARRGANFSIFTNWADFTLPDTIPDTKPMADLRRAYADRAAPQVYEHLRTSTKNLAGFVINDPDRNDERLAWLVAPDAPPHVVLGRPPGRRPNGLVTADVDDASGFGDLVRELWDSGARRIGHVGFAGDGTGPPVRRRKAVGQTLLDLTGRDLPERWSIQVSYRPEDPRAEIARLQHWLERCAWEAVVCDCDRFASYVEMAAQNLGLQITLSPHQGAVVLAGCDNSAERNAGPVHWLTLEHPYRAWAGKALDLLSEQVRSPGTRPKSTNVRPTLVPGELGYVHPSPTGSA